jgi:hypothetical protein
VEQVLAVYGLLANLKEGFTINNVVFVSSAVIFSSLIFVTCNTAQSATEEVGIFFALVGVLNAYVMQCRMGDVDGDHVNNYK